MKTFFLFILILTHFVVKGQVPQPNIITTNCLGGDGFDIVTPYVTQTYDGGFITLIQSNSTVGSGNIDSFCLTDGNRKIFAKYNSDASIKEWSKCYEIPGDTMFLYMFPRNDGSAILGGVFNSSYAWGFYIAKHDENDNIIWSHAYSKGNNLILRSMVATTDGGYIMVGESHYIDSNVYTHYGSWMDPDIFVIKVDSNGNKIWTKVIGGSADDQAASVILAPDDGVYVIGTTSSNDYDCTGNHSSASDVYVVRLDKNGNKIWHRDLGGSAIDYGRNAAPDGKGGILIAADSYSPDGDVSYINTGQNIWVVNLDSSNSIVWQHCYGGGGGTCYPNAICRSVDGSVWIAGVSHLKYGEIDTGYGRDDAWFLHIDSVGLFLNAKVLGSHMDDNGMMIYPLSNGNVIAGGFYDASSPIFNNVWKGSHDAFFVILSPYPTHIISPKPDNKIQIFPNPTHDFINIKKEKLSDEYSVSVSNNLGNQVYRSKLARGDHFLNIEVRNWVKGNYFVCVSNENGYIYTSQVLIK